MKLNPLLKGTLMLTIAGFITRFLGFLYRIFLSNAMGAERLGMYQLIFPIYGICHTIYAAGIQTSLSKHVAECISCGKLSTARKLLLKCLFLSVSLATFLTLIIYINAGLIATYILMEPKTEAAIRTLSFCFPFCGITSCINGYYYGCKKTTVPATTQLFEQLVRILFVYMISVLFSGGSASVSCELAVMGIVVGEIASSIYNLISLYRPRDNESEKSSKEIKPFMKSLIKMAVPLSLNRLLLNILHSFEAILVPVLLRKNGMNNADALAVFGIVTGMAVPFLAFPSTLTNSLSVLLLPEISEAAYGNKTKQLSRTIQLSVKYSLQLGIISTALFTFFGNKLGTLIFGDSRVGTYLVLLSFLCPLMYLSTTLGSILNGLGKQNYTFLNSVIGSTLKLVLLALLIPFNGIFGYFIALYMGQILIIILDILLLSRSCHITADISNMLLKPVGIAFFGGLLLYKIYDYISVAFAKEHLILLLLFCTLYVLIYIIFLKFTNCLKKSGP